MAESYMTEQEKEMLIKTEQRSKSNEHRIDAIDEELKEIKAEQKAIYKIATSVEVIAQRVSNIEEKVDATSKKVNDTNEKVNAQVTAWQETEQRLTERIVESENRPLKQVASNVNSIKVAIITAICTLLATGIIAAVVTFAK